MTEIQNAVEIVKALHRGGDYGYFWSLRGKTTHWYDRTKSFRIPVGTDIYWGVHPTNCIPTTNTDGQRVEPAAVRGRKEIVSHVNCMFAEFDAKDYGNSLELALHQATERCFAAPSVIIESGGGYHCYWLLDETYEITSDAARKRIDALQSLWVKFTGGDKGSKDLARVLRVPGTRNGKYSPMRDVTVKSMDLGLRYSLGVFDALVEETRLTDGMGVRKPIRAATNTSADVADALARLSLVRVTDYHDWIRVGMALYGLGSEGLGLWHQWSAQSPKYDDSHLEYAWKHFKPDGGVTMASLYYWANHDTPRAATAAPVNTRNLNAAPGFGGGSSRDSERTPNAFAAQLHAYSL